MAGSMNSFHEYFDPMFLLAVYLTADAKVRVNVFMKENKKSLVTVFCLAEICTRNINSS